MSYLYKFYSNEKIKNTGDYLEWEIKNSSKTLPGDYSLAAYINYISPSAIGGNDKNAKKIGHCPGAGYVAIKTDDDFLSADDIKIGGGHLDSVYAKLEKKKKI